jgi:hypothetical protein
MARDSGAARDVRPQEAVTLDIVAELFDLLFGDPSVADGIKALVARLQSTVLKAAMLNQRFFADRSHPARRFLDSISTVAIRWGKVVNADDPFYRKLPSWSTRSRPPTTATWRVRRRERGAGRLPRRTREDRGAAGPRTGRGRARPRRGNPPHPRRPDARATAANQCIERVLGPAGAAEIEEFLRSYWRDVVQGRISRAGEDGAPTTDALRTAVALILAVTPKHDPDPSASGTRPHCLDC